MRPSTVVVGALCGFPLLEAATIWPRFSLAIANDHYLSKRIEPIIPKPPPKVIEPPPKLGTGSGASCKRSWLWTRCTPPPSGPHLGEGSSGNGNSDPGSSVGGNPSSNPGSSGQGSSGAPHLGDSSPGRPSSNPGSSPGASGSDASDLSLLSTISERMVKVNTEPGIDQILPPSVYVDRGRQLLQANKDAAAANPRVDKTYDNWSVRYNKAAHEFDDNGPIPANTITSNPADTKAILEHPDIGLNAEKPWTYAGYVSKGEQAAAETAKRDPRFVATVWVDKEGGAVMATDSDSAVDLNLGQDATKEPPRLFNSELIYQTWKEEIERITPSVTGKQIGDLKFVVRFPIANAGTRITIKDAYTAKGITDTSSKATFYPTDTNYAGILGDSWSGITGTVNGRPTPLMGADHALPLGGLQIVKIHAWYEIPSDRTHSALVFELGRV